MSAAFYAKDPDAAVRFGGLMETCSFRDKYSSGKPIPLVDRRRNLYVQSLKMLRDVNVKGGYLLDDRAVLVIDARDGIGWIVRGPIVVARDGNIWEHAGGNTVNYPASN